MKILDLNPVTPSVGVIIQKNTLLHITDAYKESFESLGKSMLPVSAYTGKLVVLYGCVITGTNPGARTITAGAVFYNGQVYQVQASTFTTTGSQIGIWTLVDLNAASIESKLTDGTDVHMLVNNAFVFSAGAAASGLFDETSASIERVGTWKIGASSILFSSIVGSGMSLSAGSSKSAFMISNKTLFYKAIVIMTVTNATLVNSGSDMSTRLDMNKVSGLESIDFGDLGDLAICELSSVYGTGSSRDNSSSEMRIGVFIKGVTAVNGQSLTVKISGSWALL